jgi:hypothetical protein
VLESIGAPRKIFAKIDKTMVKNLNFQKLVRYGSKTSRSSFGQSTMCVLYFAYNLQDVVVTIFG